MCKIRLPKIVEYRMTRVTFGVTSSPFLLAATLRHHLNTSHQEYGVICDKLKQCFYVDDLVMSERSLEEAKLMYLKSKEIMAKARFNLRKWNTNDPELSAFFLTYNNEQAISQKVLGINWTTANDEISVSIESISEYLVNLRSTKRNVMKAMAKIYDPLGMLGPFTVRIKLILQNIWKENLEWDEALSGDNMNDFQNWQEEIKALHNFNMGRCLATESDSQYEVHIFADASPKAYGAVAYVRQLTAAGIITTNFICSKNRVSPMEKSKKQSELTLPKLELTAALTAARLKIFLVDALDFEVHSVTLWSDSAIALNWINGQGKQIPYVKARVSEINNITNIHDWKHCRGRNNPADLLTRGITAKALVESDLWKFGPEWLVEGELNWPSEYILEKSMSLVAESTDNNKGSIIEAVINLENYSELKRLLRVTAFVFRFVKNVKHSVINKGKHLSKPFSVINEITAHELSKAESYWIRYVQRNYYNREVVALESQRSIPTDSKILLLNPVLVDGILRLTSRLPPAIYGNYNLIILPKRSHLSSLLVWEAHKQTMHGA